MKNKILITNLLLLLILFTAFSCKEKKQIAVNSIEETNNEISVSIEKHKLKPTIVNKDYRALESDNFNLIESQIKGDILSLVVEYGGGCEAHEWELKTNGSYAKSLPPQITLHIEHNANNDKCRALLTDTIEFDLKPVRYPSQEQVIVKLNGYPEHRIRYTYDK